MSGDYSRELFDAIKDYAGVRMQQGRVQLDADWNELVSIMDRRWRAETIDIVGRAVVPSSTPDAFLVVPTGPGDFTVGVGRMYVDGLLAECHGQGAAALDDLLGERRGTAAVPYIAQPYLPAPTPLGPGAVGRTDLIYLDVFTREVSHLEDPAIREVALEGPDTTTRLQTIWQVKALVRASGATCTAPPPEWSEITAPPAGRLTTSLVTPPADDDPCIIPPGSLYRGLENRLYRVQVHAAGTVGGATPARFKWSRDGGSVCFGLEQVSPGHDVLTMERLGRDDVLRFGFDDRVEVLDDALELGPGAGHMARVVDLDEATRTLTIAPPLPAAFVLDPARHPRVRRWDQRNGVDAEGLVAVTAGPIELEDGVQVGFSADPVGGRLRAGDYWLIAARTATGDIDHLQQAVPRGIHHHFAKLAVVTWGPTPVTTQVEDCREHWPHGACDGCCTVTVGDGVDSHGDFTDIQQAIDALGPAGGVICLGRGVFSVSATIQLQGQRNVTIRGMGPATRIIFAPPDPGPPCFLLGKSHDLRLERLLVASRSAAVLVRVADCQRVVLAEAILINLTTGPGGAGPVPSGAGVALQDLVTDVQVRECAVLAAKGVTGAGAAVRDVAVVRCLLLTAHVGVQLQEVSGLEVRGNRMRGIAPAAWLALASGPPLARATIDGVQDAAGALFSGGLGTQDLALAGVLVFSGRQVTIADNAIVARFGVAGFLLIDARLRDNDILAIAGVALVFALMVHVTGSTVLALAMGLVHGGLAGDLRVEDSTWLGYYGVALFSLGQIAVLLAPLLSGQNIAAAVQQAQSLNGQLAAFGLAAIVRVERNLFASFLTGVLKSERVASADFAIVDNTFLGASRAGVDLGSDHGSALGPVADLLNLRHLIQANALNVTGVGISSASDHAMIEGNSVVAGAVGILVDGAGATVRGNLVRGRLRAAALVEIHGGATEVVVAANRLEDAPGHGVVVVEPVRRVRIEDNEVRRIGLNAIETVTDTVMVSGLSVSGNQIEECGRGPGSAWRRGAIVLGGGLDVRISGNTLRANGAPSDSGFTPIYVEDLVGGAVSDNLVTVNPGGGGPLLSRGSIVLQSARAFVQVQGNRVEGNPGFGLLILERPGADPVQHVQVHGNVFGRATDASPGGAWILEADTATFEGNRVQVLPPPGFPPVPAVAVFGGQVIATGNIVETTGQWGLWVGATGRGIVTSNLSAGILTAGPVLRASNNPAP